MREELTIKKDKFWQIINRESFLLLSFNVRLQYRISAKDNNYFYVKIICDNDNTTAGEHAEQYIMSYLDPKHTRNLDYSSKSKSFTSVNQLLNRLMKEYLVHIEINDRQNQPQIKFQSSSLTVLFLAIDDFRKSISNDPESEKATLDGSQQLLDLLSTTFERQLSTFDEEDPNIPKSEYDDDDELQDQSSFVRGKQEPSLRIAFPGAKQSPSVVDLKELPVKPSKKKKRRAHSRSPSKQTGDVNDNDLVREMRQKLKGQQLRDVIIDGANVGRTYGGSEFSPIGIKLAVDQFRSYGFPDSKIVVIIPAHYLRKDQNNILRDLIHRKILHKAFEQKVEDESKRFYDDRLIVDLAVMRKGVILSNDYYRDIYKDSNEAVRNAIRERLLCYRFIGDDLCLPNPVCEGGLALEKFLSM